MIATFPTCVKLSFSGENKAGIQGLVLQFSSASLMNYMRDHAKVAHVLKSMVQASRAQSGKSCPASPTSAWRCTGCRNATVPGLPETVQNPSPDPPSHKTAAPRQALADTC